MRDRIKSLRRVRASELSPHPLNWRTHPEGQRRAMQAALAEIGWADALLVRETADGLQIIDGHLRADVAVDDKVPVLVLDVDEDEAAKLLATVDPLAAMAGIDVDTLDQLLDGIHFDDAALAELAGSLAPKMPEVGEVNTPEAEEGEPVTQPGDVWVCGPHRVVCGDSREVSAAGMEMVTDPPYGIGYEYESYEDDADQTAALVSEVVVAHDGPKVFTPGLMNLSRILGQIPVARVLVWHKCFAAAGNGLGGASTWEPVVVHGVVSPRLPDDYLRFTTDRIEGLRNLHSCPKPIALFAHLIDKLTAGTVYDPFLGSGTTLIAADQLGRTCYGVEIEPKYVDVICRRYLAHAGQSPVRESDGVAFADLI